MFEGRGVQGRRCTADHGDAEIGELDPTVGGQQDVARLDVAVHDAAGVSVHERSRHLTGKGDRGLDLDGAVVGERVGQRTAWNVLHDETRVAVAGLGEPVDDGQVLVAAEVGEDAGLPLETADTVVVEMAQHLDSDLPAERVVVGRVHGGETAPPDLDVVLQPGNAEAGRLALSRLFGRRILRVVDRGRLLIDLRSLGGRGWSVPSASTRLLLANAAFYLAPGDRSTIRIGVPPRGALDIVPTWRRGPERARSAEDGR